MPQPSRRDDFTARTREILARRVAYRCSNPNCQRPTTGPHIEAASAINIGVAAHISAASPGGRRFDPSLTKEQRRSPDNGIWLCQSCGKLIDSDEGRFSVELVRLWKVSAEQRALLELMSPPSLDTLRAAATDLDSIRRGRDLGVLRLLFDNLHIPTIDQFISGATGGSFHDSALYFEDRFRAIVEAPSFHMNNPQLEQKARDLSGAFASAFGYSDYFFHGPILWVYQFDRSAEDAEQVFGSFVNDLARLGDSFADFVSYVQAEYPELDLARTNSNAMALYTEELDEIQGTMRRKSRRAKKKLGT